jgi:hypothetical protein
MRQTLYKLIFFVPVKMSEKVKEAIFKTGAGTVGEYSRCSFETQGTGQFMPSAKANPAIGSSHNLEKVLENKVEILCTSSQIQDAVTTLKEVHPYEEVAYEVYRLEDF